MAIVTHSIAQVDGAQKGIGAKEQTCTVMQVVKAHIRSLIPGIANFKKTAHIKRSLGKEAKPPSYLSIINNAGRTTVIARNLSG